MAEYWGAGHQSSRTVLQFLHVDAATGRGELLSVGYCSNRAWIPQVTKRPSGRLPWRCTCGAANLFDVVATGANDCVDLRRHVEVCTQHRPKRTHGSQQA